MEFIDVNIRWMWSTLVFYTLIPFVVYMIAYFAGNKRIRLKTFKGELQMPLDVICAGMFLILVKTFCFGARDIRTGYYMNWLSASSYNHIYDYTLEPGYKLLMVLVHTIFGNSGYVFFLFFTSLLTIVPIMWGINKERDEIDVPIALLVYTSIFYFQSFSANRIYIAASFGMLALIYLKEKKYNFSLAWILISVLFHRTAVILIPIVFLVSLERKIGYKYIIILAIICVLCIFYRENMVVLAGLSSRYKNYFEIREFRFGLEQIAYYFPIIFLIFYTAKKEKNTYIDYSVCIYGLFLGEMSYLIPIFGRFQAMFVILMIIISSHYKKIYNKSSKWICKCLILVYCFIRLQIYLIQYWNLEDLMPYYFGRFFVI